ncbi:M20/M25/M40 family metallo-hydrolase [Melioribacteraceae bacterium 4301-Me]|uniref:M20/M25/M40 family metallo-hydrolase n=1 Tax=Pyranulibacter aquaticus TaxID=3163344 RepID=UPI003597333B
MQKKTIFSLFIVLIFSFTTFSQQKVDLNVIQQIRHEGLENSKVMEILSYLTDVYGPRLANSPSFFKAANWTVEKLKEYGLKNAHLEPFGTFGRGWEFNKFYMAMTEPTYMPIIGYPKAWTGSTNGLIKGSPILIKIEKAEDIEQYKGKLKDAIVLTQPEQTIEETFKPDATRRTETELAELAKAPEPSNKSSFADRFRQFRERRMLMQKINEFLVSEGVKLVIEPSRGMDGTVFVQSGGSYNNMNETSLPQVVISTEQYNRIVRILEKNIPVEIEAEIQTKFYNQDSTGYNIIAEIPGTDKNLKDQIVMLGGHFDSWHSGTGATDNAAGCAVAIEAVRILEKLGLKPKRTIRIALWDGEEEGLIGSRAYVKNHFFDIETKEKKPEYDNFFVYFNYDNGSGKIRGIYLQGNDAARPIFEEWFKPFNDLGASTVTIRNTGSTDHVSFDAVGLPGFQFIQDELAYGTRTHHSNMDVYDHCSAGDLMQSAVIMASFIYNASVMDGKFPRKYFNPNEVSLRRGF